MHFKQKLIFMALGSTLTLAGYLLATLVSDVTAQSETDKSTVFDEIVCRKLKVVDADGKPVVLIGTLLSSGDIKLFTNKKHVHQSNRLYVRISASAGGYMGVYPPDGSKPLILIGADTLGSFLKMSRDSKEVISMGTTPVSSEGFIQIKRKDQTGSVQLGGDEYGGSMEIFNNAGKNVFRAAVSDIGGGIITTNDKHGYKTGHLP